MEKFPVLAARIELCADFDNDSKIVFVDMINLLKVKDGELAPPPVVEYDQHA